MGLFFEVVGELHPSLSLLFPFLLLSNGEFLVSELPELSKFLLLPLLVLKLLIFPIDLVFSALLDGMLKFKSLSLLIFEKLIRFVLSFGDLFIKNLLFLISNLHKLSNLSVNELLSGSKFVLEPFLLFSFFEMIEGVLFLGILFDSLFFLSLFESDFGLDLKEFLVGFFEFLPSLSSSLLALDISKFFSFDFLLNLLFDELAFELLLLHLFDVVELEIF